MTCYGEVVDSDLLARYHGLVDMARLTVCFETVGALVAESASTTYVAHLYTGLDNRLVRSKSVSQISLFEYI